MAEASKTSSGGGGSDILSQVLITIVVIFFSGLILANYNLDFFNFSKQDDQGADDQLLERKTVFAFPTGKIKLGNDVINKKEVDIYRVAGNFIIGQQKKWEVGKPVEGPIEIGDRLWWRIDYEQAPDGWVRQNNLTDYVWTYRILNFFPIIFTTLTPVLILLSIIIFILIITVMLKTSALQDLKRRKLELQRQRTVKDEIIEEVKREKDDEFGEPEKDVDQNVVPTNLPTNLPVGNIVPKVQDVHNRRWTKVESLIHSHSTNDWRQAILEADIMLDEMLDKIGYKGKTIAEKLKQVEESDFLTLQQAWEAHKIRNRIAHHGSNYVLTKNDAERAFKLFKEVFEEFYLI